jgi:hypothetical protein
MMPTTTPASTTVAAAPTTSISASSIRDSSMNGDGDGSDNISSAAPIMAASSHFTDDDATTNTNANTNANTNNKLMGAEMLIQETDCCWFMMMDAKARKEERDFLRDLGHYIKSSASSPSLSALSSRSTSIPSEVQAAASASLCGESIPTPTPIPIAIPLLPIPQQQQQLGGGDKRITHNAGSSSNDAAVVSVSKSASASAPRSQQGESSSSSSAVDAWRASILPRTADNDNDNDNCNAMTQTAGDTNDNGDPHPHNHKDVHGEDISSGILRKKKPPKPSVIFPLHPPHPPPQAWTPASAAGCEDDGILSGLDVSNTVIRNEPQPPPQAWNNSEEEKKQQQGGCDDHNSNSNRNMNDETTEKQHGTSTTPAAKKNTCASNNNKTFMDENNRKHKEKAALLSTRAVFQSLAADEKTKAKSAAAGLATITTNSNGNISSSSSATIMPSMGRGVGGGGGSRGRGRGRGVSNKPAWMTQNAGPAGVTPTITAAGSAGMAATPASCDAALTSDNAAFSEFLCSLQQDRSDCHSSPNATRTDSAQKDVDADDAMNNRHKQAETEAATSKQASTAAAASNTGNSTNNNKKRRRGVDEEEVDLSADDNISDTLLQNGTSLMPISTRDSHNNVTRHHGGKIDATSTQQQASNKEALTPTSRSKEEKRSQKEIWIKCREKKRMLKEIWMENNQPDDPKNMSNQQMHQLHADYNNHLQQLKQQLQQQEQQSQSQQPQQQANKHGRYGPTAPQASHDNRNHNNNNNSISRNHNPNFNFNNNSNYNRHNINNGRGFGARTSARHWACVLDHPNFKYIREDRDRFKDVIFGDAATTAEGEWLPSILQMPASLTTTGSYCNDIVRKVVQFFLFCYERQSVWQARQRALCTSTTTNSGGENNKTGGAAINEPSNAKPPATVSSKGIASVADQPGATPPVSAAAAAPLSPASKSKSAASAPHAPPKAWTNDDIFQRYRFCNVYRELDAGTMYLHRAVGRLWCESQKRLLKEKEATKYLNQGLHHVVRYRPHTNPNMPSVSPTNDRLFIRQTLWTIMCYRLLNKSETFEVSEY